MQHSNIGGMQDFRRYQDGERHIKAVRGAKRFFIVIGLLVLLALASMTVSSQIDWGRQFNSQLSAAFNRLGMKNMLKKIKSGTDPAYVEASCQAMFTSNYGGWWNRYWSLNDNYFKQCLNWFGRAGKLLRQLEWARSKDDARSKAYQAANAVCYTKYALTRGNWGAYSRCRNYAYNQLSRI